MNIFIEDAIIVEVYEEEPHFKVETVYPEIIKPKKKRKRKPAGLFDSLFDIFLEPLDIFGFNDLFGLNEYEEEPVLEPQKQSKKPQTEIALITETNEAKVKEYRFMYYEVEAN